MERRASALQRLVLLLLLALVVECAVSSSSPTSPPSTRRASTTKSSLPSQASSPFVSGATFTISSTEAFVTPEQQAALEAALPACVGLFASDEDEEATPTTIKTSSTTSEACG